MKTNKPKTTPSKDATSTVEKDQVTSAKKSPLKKLISPSKRASESSSSKLEGAGGDKKVVVGGLRRKWPLPANEPEVEEVEPIAEKQSPPKKKLKRKGLQ